MPILTKKKLEALGGGETFLWGVKGHWPFPNTLKYISRQRKMVYGWYWCQNARNDTLMMCAKFGVRGTKSWPLGLGQRSNCPHFPWALNFSLRSTYKTLTLYFFMDLCVLMDNYFIPQQIRGLRGGTNNCSWVKGHWQFPIMLKLYLGNNKWHMGILGVKMHIIILEFDNN